jgi:hypothetical protein
MRAKYVNYIMRIFWLEEKGILPDIDGANDAAEDGQIDGILWLEEKVIVPDINWC